MDKQKKFKVPKPLSNINVKPSWTVIVLVMSFVISVAFSAVTTMLMADLSILWAFIILFVIIAINVLFDMVGTAVMSAEEYPFHSLAARKVHGAKQAIKIIRHAPQVSSISCDVIGDIAGIISGAATAIIVAELAMAFGTSSILPNLLLTGLVASLTIGGKAVGKGTAMQNGNSVVFLIGKLMYYIKLR